jgi:hypothetical protein
VTHFDESLMFGRESVVVVVVVVVVAKARKSIADVSRVPVNYLFTSPSLAMRRSFLLTTPSIHNKPWIVPRSSLNEEVGRTLGRVPFQSLVPDDDSR